MSMDHQH
jgi:serine/threonine protein kinase